MSRAQLWHYLKDNGISQEQAARRLGFSHAYVNRVLTGRSPLTDAVKFRFVECYPETAAFLLPHLCVPQEAS